MQQWVCTGTGFSASIICVIVPVIIGAQVRGMLFQAGGGISGGMVSIMEATIDWTIPMPTPKPRNAR